MVDLGKYFGHTKTSAGGGLCRCPKNTMSKIILNTQRLRLEKIEKSHLNDLYALVSNPKVQRYFPKTLNRNETKEFYEKIQNRYETDGYCYWAVVREGDNQFIGICGILKQEVDGQVETEIGYRILDMFWGKGYGTEAAEGCIKYAKEKLKKTSVISLIRSVNAPSKRVAEKNGLKFEKESIFHGLPHLVYRLLLKQ